ncbi:cobalt-precorrin-5B (C(1))-methyltransferase [Methylorubrum extorquens]|uniref:Cobalt-precorrin-5B C(1)-methyltransferase n=1 Tax=Methylorubrum extorquens (strain CM4 / NCIMB 13688) TaxID=440085 RepID=CBID_METC4|nr:cobalt-precorrin-5B (C(1))-methyltransferase [Methylorubrum extorquens]Q9X7G7.1 RecName: Full=Cobalt-precorrin-5B C(1)-methyltransferase; AltName: Full=Cobalt-precorrin-6A synthase [Methylorubrum extorquens CM4]ACK86443.1 cobalamin biosynthesis protein CbiD [Methylorubrum extorquens CM4]CAB40740.1 Orf361 [Methylorubrum extorquens CM4]
MNSETGALRRGWTTGTCASAAARAAFEALLGIEPEDPVPVTLPSGARPTFALARLDRGSGFVRAGIVKDAGDDPDVTHGALVLATLRFGAPATGIVFRAGPGVGIVTKPGLPLPPGEPAINAMPRRMIRTALTEVAEANGVTCDLVVEVGIEDGERIAERTMNRRLGIIGGLSILGTTGVVVPYSCAAWIASIHRGIDVARAEGLTHLAGATGATSEAAIRNLYGLPEQALIDMGDFVGGMLKYIRGHPVARVTIAGGFAKMTKLAQGRLDLHSKREAIDFRWLAELYCSIGGKAESGMSVRTANTALEVLQMAQAEHVPIAPAIARSACRVAAGALARADIALDVAIFDRDGCLIASERC